MNRLRMDRPGGAGTNRRARPSCDEGYSLTELLLAMTAGMVVLAAVLHTFNIVHAQAVRQQRGLARQQDLRLGLEVFEQEVRLATPASIIKAAADEVIFTANLNALTTSLTASALSGQTVLSVQDGTGWSAGKTVVVCGLSACESHRLSRDGQRNLLTLAEPMGLTLPSGASVEVRNRVSYYARRDESGLVKMLRMVDGGANTVIGDLKAVQFAYRDADGRSTTVPASVKRVAVVLTPSHSVFVVVREVGLRS